MTTAARLDAMPGTKERRNIHPPLSVPVSDPDWRPDNHVFTDVELRDRFMRFGGVDAATAWHLIDYVRDRQPAVDWERTLAASVLGYWAP